MILKQRTGKPTFLGVSEDSLGQYSFTFARAFKSEAQDMLAQLPAYLAFLHMEVALEYFTAEAATRAHKSPWDDVKKCVHSALDNELDTLLTTNHYGWNIMPTKFEGTAEAVQEAQAQVEHANTFLGNGLIETFRDNTTKVKALNPRVTCAKRDTNKVTDDVSFRFEGNGSHTNYKI